MTGDRIFGAVMVLLALGYILSARTIQVPLFPDPMGPKAFPFLIGAGVIVCGLVMMVRPDPEADWPSAGALLSLAFATVVMVAYAYSLKPLGFLIPTAIASGILSYQLSPRLVAAPLTGLGLSIGLFILFRHGLGLSLNGISEAGAELFPFVQSFVDWLDWFFAALAELISEYSDQLRGDTGG